MFVAHTLWRVQMGTAPAVAIYADTALFTAGIVTGAFLQWRHRRLLEIGTERDRLVRALATGPGDAATAEQLRTWSLLEQRIETDPLRELLLPAIRDDSKQHRLLADR